MKKKKDEFYFKNLSACVNISYQAAQFLAETLADFSVETIRERLDQMHELEQKGDVKKHKMMTALSQAFITPIEREDLVSLSNYLDDITDAVEDVMLQIYMCNVDKIREDVPQMTELLLECISTLQDVVDELKRFKSSKTIEDSIIRVNDLEEKGDRMYVDCMHRLYGEDELRTIVVWRNIYACIENCMDMCEHAADIVNTVMMKNS